MWSMADKWQNFQNFHGKTEVVDEIDGQSRRSIGSRNIIVFTHARRKYNTDKCIFECALNNVALH